MTDTHTHTHIPSHRFAIAACSKVFLGLPSQQRVARLDWILEPTTAASGEIRVLAMTRECKKQKEKEFCCLGEIAQPVRIGEACMFVLP